MRIGLLLLCLHMAFAALAAQTTGSATISNSSVAGSPIAANASMNLVLPALDSLQAAASQATTDIAHLRIEKWKADGESKRQAQNNADSIQRNLTSALPGLIDGVRSSPQDLSAAFKLYRNLNVLYDVLGSLTESAGAFGPRSDYEELTQQLQVIDWVRRNLGDALERLTASTQAELAQLRSQIRAQQQIAPAAPPKKVVVDETAPAPKASRQKKKPAVSSSNGSDSNGPASDNSSAGPPKP